MNKNDWIFIAKFMWEFSEEYPKGRLAKLLKELVLRVNKNMEVIIDDMDKNGKNVRSDRPIDSNSTSSVDFKKS